MRKDDVTGELPGVPRRRGRPATGKGRTSAQRMADFRERKADQGKVELPAMWVHWDVAEALRGYVARKNANTAVEPITLGDAVEAIVRDRIMRKRPGRT